MMMPMATSVQNQSTVNWDCERKEAKALAFGSKPSIDLAQYYDAWQWLMTTTTYYLNVADAALHG